MAVRTVAMLGVICAIVTRSYSSCCVEDFYNMDNVACDPSIRFVATFKVLSDPKPHRINPQCNVQDIKLVKTYKCSENASVICHPADGTTFFTQPGKECKDMLLETGEVYLIADRGSYSSSTSVSYNECSMVKKWNDVKEDEYKLLKQQGTDECTPCFV